ncbi:GNAT family N-acetyltransferase [Pararhodospirillum oryzae]|uniref:L-ornithine N(alpha)-acyltransferase n=1 Tax=Pararhodospirillum oryzae TaxID=478448 RepID=A0A512H7H2_9PROT|nr:GNAT family N-acyltransferase [Pararhodospirillum oryzae]GEO81384.1 ornithine-acyl ACP N-acyltransferase [Pararhodospirillum oryzae]
MGVLGDLRAGALEVTLAQAEADVQAALSLRYRVFYEEMGARPTPAMAARRQDFDAFDEYVDHLLVIDHALGQGPERVVGCYRLMRREQAARMGRFYSADEYDLAPLLAVEGNVMELGRSCVDASHRNRSTMQLLWRGIAAYVHRYDIALMFGCASLHGTNPADLAPQLSYLYHHHLAPEALRPRALPERFSPMNLLPAEEIDARRVMTRLPPLIKGYLRLGGFFGDGAVVDHQFNTTDVCVIVKSDLISDKYNKHYDLTARDLDL